MREIKFRARSGETGEWEYFDFRQAWQVRKLSERIERGWVNGLSQFTGLKDKNGKDVFKGDIVKDGKGQYGQVLWAHNSYLIEWNERDSYGHRTYDTITDDCFGYGEVVGNIYENPELLK